MYSGIRLSELAVGEPLLGIAWEFKGHTGKEAVIKRLEEQFYYASYLNFKYAIDTIIPQVTNNSFTLENNGIHGDIWTFEERIEKYISLAHQTNISLVMEIKFPIEITENNVDEYIHFILELIGRYYQIRYWIIGVAPDALYEDNITYNCKPELYNYLIEKIYYQVKAFDSDIKIGGPNIHNSLLTYINTKSGWLRDAIDNKNAISNNSFLTNIDFFAIGGKQSTTEITYENYSDIINNIRAMFYEYTHNSALTIFATNQGHRSNYTTDTAYDEQAYLDIREILKAVKCGIIPFKRELIDAYGEINAWEGLYDEARQNYGILTYYMSTKSSYGIYQFVLTALEKFSTVVADSQVYEKNENLDSITLQNESDGLVTNITIIWPKSYSTETVVLLPASYLREYQTQNGTRTAITHTVEINLKHTHFLIVYERVQRLELSETDMSLNITRRLRYQKEILNQMIQELPSSFNKETTDINLYRLLRAVAIELADATLSLTMIKEDAYLNTARGDAIYQNFGRLVRLQKRSDWTHEKYRRLVKGILMSLLKGPTTNSITSALQLFTNFKISISELYKESAQIKYKDLISHYNPKFTFIVEIEKPLNNTEAGQEEIIEDTTYLLKLVKPAHTIGILIVILSGEENWQSSYKDKYNIDWNNGDDIDLNVDMSKILDEGKFGWKSFNYPGAFQISPNKHGIYSNVPLINNGLLGPRYTLFDTSVLHNEKTIQEQYKNTQIKELLLQYIDQNAYEEYNEYKEQVVLNADLFEPKFGYYDNEYIQFNQINPEKILNKYKLGGRNTKLKDEVIVEPNKFLQDKYIFTSVLKAIKFSKTGVGYHFTTDNNIITEWSEFLHELPFKQTIETKNGKTFIIERTKEFTEQVIEGYKEQFRKTRDLLEKIAHLDEYINISDDPLSAFRFNYLYGLNSIKLKSKSKEKVNYSVDRIEIYNRAHDYLAHIMEFSFKEIYDRNITDNIIEFNPIYTDYFESFKNNYLALQLPKDLQPIQYAIIELINFLPEKTNSTAENIINNSLTIQNKDKYYGKNSNTNINHFISFGTNISDIRSLETDSLNTNNNEYASSIYKNYQFLTAEQIENIIKDLAFRYNLSIDTSKSDIQYWINSIHGVLRDPLHEEFSIFKPFIKTNTEKLDLGIRIKDIVNLNSITSLFSFYCEGFNDFYTPKKDEPIQKDIDFTENIIVHDNLHIPFTFSTDRNKILNNDFTNINFFYNQRSLLTSVSLDGYKELFKQIHEEIYTHIVQDKYREYLKKVVEKYHNDITTDLTDYNEIYSEYNALQLNKPLFNIKRFLTVYQTKTEIATKLIEKQYKVKTDKFIRHLNDIKYDFYQPISDISLPISTELYEEHSLQQYFNLPYNNFYFNNSFTRQFKGAHPEQLSIDLYNDETFISAIEYCLFNLIYNDRYHELQDNSTLYAAADLYEHYEIVDEDKHFVFNQHIGKISPKKNNRIHYLIEIKPYENYHFKKEDLFEYLILLNEDKFNPVKEEYKASVNNYIKDNFNLYDDEKVILQLQNKYDYKKFIKYRTAIYQFDPYYIENINYNIKENINYNIDSADKDKYQPVIDTNYYNFTYYSDRFTLYDNDNVFIFNKNNNHLLSKRNFIYSFHTLFNEYYTAPFEKLSYNIDFINLDSYATVIDNFNTTAYLNDKFILLDDDKNIILNTQNGYFPSKKYFTYSFNPIIKENYNKTINENLHYIINNFILEQYQTVIDNITKETYLNDQFILRDDDNNLTLNKQNGFLPGGKYFSYSFNPDIADIYFATIQDKFYSSLTNLLLEQYNTKDDTPEIGNYFTDTYILNDNPLRLNNYSNKAFIGTRIELYNFYVNTEEYYDKEIIDSNTIKSESNNTDIYSGTEENAEVYTFLDDAFILKDEDRIKYLRLMPKNNNDNYFNIFALNSTSNNDDINYDNISGLNTASFIGIKASTFDTDLNKNDIYNIETITEKLTYSIINLDVEYYQTKYDSLEINNNFINTETYVINNPGFILNKFTFNKKTNKFISHQADIYDIYTNVKDIYADIDENYIFTNIYKNEENYQFKEEYLEVTQYLIDIFNLYDEDNIFKFNNHPNRLLGKRSNLITFSVKDNEIYDELFDKYSFYTVYNQQDTYTKGYDDISINSYLTEDFNLYDEDNVFKFNNHPNRLLGKRSNLITFSLDKFEEYNNIIDKFSLYNFYYIKDKYNFKEENLIINPQLNEEFILYDEDNVFKFNNHPNRLLGKRNNLIIFSAYEFEKYNNIIDKSFLYSFYIKKEKYTVKNEELTEKESVLSDEYELYDEDNALKLNNLPNRLLSKRNSLTFSVQEKDKYKDLLDKYSLYNFYTNNEIFHVKEEEFALVYEFFEKYNIIDEDNNLTLNKVNGKFINKKNIYTFITYLYEKFNNIKERLINLNIHYTEKEKFNTVIDKNYLFEQELKERYFLTDEDNALCLNKSNGQFLGCKNIYTLATYLYDKYSDIFESASLISSYITNDKYQFKEDKPTIDADLADTFPLFDEDQAFTLSKVNGHLYGKKHTDIIFTGYKDDIYNYINETGLYTYIDGFEDSLDNYLDNYLLHLKKWDSDLYQAVNDLFVYDININTVDYYGSIKDDKHIYYITDFNDLYKPKADEKSIHNKSIYEETFILAKERKIFKFNTNKFNNNLSYVDRDIFNYNYSHSNTDKFNNIKDKYNEFVQFYLNDQYYTKDDNYAFEHIFTSFKENYLFEIKENNYFSLYNKLIDNYKNIKDEITKKNINSTYKEKFESKSDNVVKVKKEITDTYHKLNISSPGLKFNKMILNKGKFILITNEQFSLRTNASDKYTPKASKELGKKVTLKEKINKAKDTLAHITPGILEETFITAHRLNPFEFVQSRFNRQQFMRKDISDQYTFNSHNADKIKKPLLILNNINLELTREKMNKPTEKNTAYISYFNNEIYRHNKQDIVLFNIDFNKDENYALNSSVAYISLEKKLNNKYIIIRKESIV